MRIRILVSVAFLAALLTAAGCRRAPGGPLAISAIGGEPHLANPNRGRLDPPSGFLLQSVAQGLVRFDSGGDVVPGLAQSWIVSSDGLRYTFRLQRADWPHGGGRIAADQVVARLKAAIAAGSRNELKPVLGAIDDIETMTDEVLEISLKSPRSNFLQLLAQPELALVRGGQGAGPYRLVRQDGNQALLSPPPRDPDLPPPPEPDPKLLLRGEPAIAAAARFALGGADLVVGGTIDDLPIASASDPARRTLVIDPVQGLFGFAFTSANPALGKSEIRQALAMALDRDSIVAAFPDARLQPREILLPPGIEGISAPAAPGWSGTPLAARRATAARAIADLPGKVRLEIRVALPDGPGGRLLFALVRRDWAAIGIVAVRVRPGQPADLALVDEVAPASLASWYLRHFSCPQTRFCDPLADQALEQARAAANQDSRRAFLIQADGIVTASTLFIPIATPVRWSLVSQRLTGFRPNIFARHPAGELLAGPS